MKRSHTLSKSLWHQSYCRLLWKEVIVSSNKNIPYFVLPYHTCSFSLAGNFTCGQNNNCYESPYHKKLKERNNFSAKISLHMCCLGICLCTCSLKLAYCHTKHGTENSKKKGKYGYLATRRVDGRRPWSYTDVVFRVSLV